MKFVPVVIASLIAAGAANAGGYTAPVVEAAPITVSPVVVDASDWTGFYAGLQYGQGTATLAYEGDDADTDFDAFGVHGGYNHDFGKYVLGGELDYNKLDLDDTDGDADLTRLRARAGYDMGRFLPYVTLGAAHISTDEEFADISETAVTYGIGADFKVTEKFTVGAEYTKQDFDDVENIDDLNLDTDMVQVRASYRF